MIKLFLMAAGMIFMSTACDNASSNTSSPTSAQHSDGVFDQEYGYVEFKHTGMNSGIEKLYWIEWGHKQYKETKTKIEMAGFSQEQELFNLIIGDDNYNLKPNKKTGTKMTNTMTSGMSGSEKREFGEEFFKQMNGKKVSTETILGKTCEVWEINQMFSKVWVWNGLALKSEVNMMGTSQTIEAVKLDLSAKPSSSLFDISDYDITEIEFPLGR